MSLPTAVRFRAAILAASLLIPILAPVTRPALAAAEEACGEPFNDFIWWNGFAGNALDNPVRAFTLFEGDLVIGGEFNYAGGVLNTPGVARWDGSGWAAIGVPPGGKIRALTVYNGELVIAGQFVIVPGVPGVSAIARWNGTSWTSLGENTPRGVVNALAVYGGKLIVGGDLSEAPSDLMSWDGTTWTAVGDAPDGGVSALYGDETGLYAGGDFHHLGAVPANFIARWDGAAWSGLGAGLDSTANAIIADGSDIVVGGAFSEAGGQPASHIARWNGAWHAYGDGINNDVLALHVLQGTLYAGGRNYSTIPGSPSFIAAWNGTSWTAVGSNTTCNVYALTDFDSKLLAGGCFKSAGGQSAAFLAAWNGTTWENSYSNYGNGLSWFAAAFQPYAGKLVVGGGFTFAGSDRLNNIAYWDGEQWTGLAGGTDGQVRALTIYNGDLIAGGAFTTAGGNVANRVARWNGSSWSALGGGFGNGAVRDLIVYDGDLYAAGDIPSLDFGTPDGIARWDSAGGTWQPLGDGLSDNGNWASVHALTIYDGKLIVGGRFALAGSAEVNAIAAWDGTSWSSLGTGMSGIDNGGQPYDAWVEALAVYDGKLIAAGDFTIAGGTSARFVAAWDGVAWSPVGAGLGSMVNALLVFEDKLVAGGPFLSTGTPCVSRIAFWDGDIWKPMGTGMNNFVEALGAWNDQLYVGGPFTRAGETTSFGIARWDTFRSMLIPVVLSRFEAVRTAEGAQITWDVAESFDHSGFHVYRETAPSPGRTLLTPTLLSGRSHYEFVDAAVPEGEVSYWLAEVSRAGRVTWIGPVPLAAGRPPSLALKPADPNPFHDATRISLTLPAAGRAVVSVFDIQGRTVTTLLDEMLFAGPHTITWQGTNSRGERIADGLYFIRLEMNGRAVTRRIMLLP